MCGICGIYNFSGKRIDRNVVRRMNDIGQHRGPDDEGFLFVNTNNNQHQQYLGMKSDPKLSNQYPQISQLDETQYNLALAFRRLSIVDLSIAGHQPMSDASGQIWLTFNGEIYNYVELKKELEGHGYLFRTSGDAEVLINSYIHWGEKCVERFIGMFSFVIWDSIKKEFFGARDRFGVKPFNYYIDELQFIWSSEEKQIIASGLVNLEFNIDTLSNFFLLNQLYDGEETFVKGIRQVLPGHSFKIINNELHFRKYWELNIAFDNSALPSQKRIEKFRELFFDSVRLRLRSDVPIGIALSGGLDSSSIAIVSKEILQDKLRTFSVYYDVDKKYDEREFIQEVLDTGGFDPVFYTQDQQVNLQAIQSWIFHQDGPTTGASPYSAYLNYKNVRKAGIIVLLNGQGGDEILAGYPYYFKYLISDQLKRLQFGKVFSNLNQWSKDQSNAYSLKQLGGGILNLFLSKDSLKMLENRKYSTPELYVNLKSHITKGEYNEKWDSDLSQSLYDTLRVSMIPHLLHWEDRNSMACSIESRVPFLDHRLVEFMFSLPNEEKIDHGLTKTLLRRSLKNELPDKILNRRDKKGFGTPTDLWTSGVFKNEIRDLLNSTSMKNRPYWNISKVQKAFDQNNFAENELWKLVTTELFMLEFEQLNRNSSIHEFN
ncbi:MAG: asparagine synthase (glutamine-hydrolyzing) [Saprospiraceae bacterium]